MIKVPLNHGAHALIDDVDEPLAAFRWYRGPDEYARRNVRLDDGSRGQLYLHREVLGLTDPTVFADHINRNRLDNRRSNLRVVTFAQNMQNRSPHGMSRFRGVTYTEGKWRARCKIAGREFALGRYQTEYEAAVAAEAFRAAHCSHAVLDTRLGSLPPCRCDMCVAAEPDSKAAA